MYPDISYSISFFFKRKCRSRITKGQVFKYCNEKYYTFASHAFKILQISTYLLCLIIPVMPKSIISSQFPELIFLIPSPPPFKNCIYPPSLNAFIKYF